MKQIKLDDTEGNCIFMTQFTKEGGVIIMFTDRTYVHLKAIADGDYSMEVVDAHDDETASIEI